MTAPQQRPRRRLSQSPLILVLAEVRFAPVLSMQQHITAVQDAFRLKGFPGHETSSLHQLQIGPAGPSVTEIPRWLFTSRNRDAFVVLGTSSLALQVTRYSGFEDFLNLLRTAIDVVEEVVSPAYAERLGLRYVDALPEVGDEVSRYFKETVLSFKAEELGVESLLSSQQVSAKTPSGRLNIRMAQVQDGALLPPDLQAPELAELSAPRSGVHAVFDIDGIDERQSEFRYADLKERFWELHDYVSSGFWNSITAEAESAWGLEEQS